jgi:hypothetical protein
LGSSQKNPFLVLYQLKESRTKENQYEQEENGNEKEWPSKNLTRFAKGNFSSLVPKDDRSFVIGKVCL